MASLGPFYQPAETAPPWDWNPGATFMRSFNDAQELKAKREQMENERQIMEILMPYRVKKAQLDLEQLKSDVKVNEASVDLRRRELELKDRALNEEIEKRKGNNRTQWLGPGRGFSTGSSSDSSTGSYSSSDEYMNFNKTPDDLPKWEESSDENLPSADEPLPDLLPIRGEASTSRANPLLQEGLFDDISDQPAEMIPRSSEGWEDSYASVKPDAASAPIGENLNSKFESGLVDNTPTSNLSANATEKLDRMMADVPDPSEQKATSQDSQVIQDVLGRWQTIQKNRKADYESAAMSGVNVPAEVGKFYEEEERALFDEADALLTAPVAKLSKAGQEAYLRQTTAARPVFPITAYNRALAMESGATESLQSGAVTPDNPQLKAAIENKKNYISTLPEDPMTWSPEQKAVVASFERPIQVLGAVPKRSTLQEVLSTRAEFDSMTASIKGGRPYAKVGADGSYEFIPPDQLEPLAAEAKLKLDALVPRLQQEDDPDLFNPARYKTEKEMLSEKAKVLERNPNAFVITPKGELSYLRNFNAAPEEQKTEDGYSKTNPLAAKAEAEKRGEQSRNEMMSLDDNIRQTQAKLDYNKFVLRNLQSPTRAGSGQIGITQNRAAQWEKTSENIRTLEGELQDLLRKKSMVRKAPRRSI